MKNFSSAMATVVRLCACGRVGLIKRKRKKEKPRHSGDIWADGAVQCFSCRCQDEIARIAWLQTSETTTACIDRLLSVRDENAINIFRSRLNLFREVQIYSYLSPDIQHPIPFLSKQSNHILHPSTNKCTSHFSRSQTFKSLIKYIQKIY